VIMEAKINEILSILRDQSKALEETRALLSDSLGRVSKLEEQVTVLQSTVSSQDREIRLLKDKANAADQLTKANNIRLIGYPATDEETKSTDGGKSFATRIYEKILKPVLAVAKAKGDITSVLSLANTVETMYRAGKISGSHTPPIVIIFNNRAARLAVLRNKRNNIPMPTDEEKSAGAKRYIIAEDLTGPSFRILRLLQADDRVSKVWSAEGQIRYVLKSDPTIKKVTSVHLSVDQIIAG
jgi:hypothetical protein